MRRFGLLFLAAFLFSLLLAWMPVSAVLASPAAAQAEEAPPAAEAPPVVEKKEIKTYTLPPERYEKAVAYSRARYRLYFVGFAYGLLVLLVVLGGRVAPRFRDWAEGSSRRRFVQAVVYVPLLLLTLAVLGLPTDIYGHWLSLTYEQSVQGWGSWLWDWSKAQLISLVVGVLLVWILYGVIRRSPRRWWFYFWLAALPIIIFLQFISPYVLEPLFFKFEPLEQTQPALVVEIEKVVGRAGLEIPRQRMFEMKASEKYKAVNAYVTGFGGSKRIVVWDTTLEKMTAPQTLLVFGHEMGHYVLGHLYKGIAFFAAVLLLFLCLGYRGLHAVLGRWGEHWAIRGVDDWASLPVLLLLLSVFGFFFSPVANSFSRYLEHQADTYGLEVTHGIVPESAEAAAGAFQVLGEINLADPNPSTFIKVWLYSHPPLNERIVFAQTYDPWGKGEPTQFVPER
ncbi:MAG: M48 family metallopeptidase [Acidobacteria bacterium]|nr:M48 family metallopeptidase [Acidobacteriota bacterium]